MKLSLSISVILVLAALLYQTGCTRIETPVRKNSGGTEAVFEEISLHPDNNEILDTQPVRIEAHGGYGTIKWTSEPYFKDIFHPATGNLVVFAPPDISQNTLIKIIATDENSSSASVEIMVIDEGDPPEPGDILLNEIAWSGTLKSAYDEYIELINNTGRDFYMNNWGVENAAGLGITLIFSGRIQGESCFLITNYQQESEKTAITSHVDFFDSSLSLPNSTFGPFLLKDQREIIFDTVGDGGKYPYGENTQDVKSSMSRYTTSSSIEWDPESWYTETVSVNFTDETRGTPGAPNSDDPGHHAPSEDEARAIITEYGVDANDETGEDWVELYITKGGSVRNFTVTDLDGTDLPITGGTDITLETGVHVLVIWTDDASQIDRPEDRLFYIQDNPPTGTKDELVVLCNGTFLDGLCYYSTKEVQFDDQESMRAFGWSGDPLHGKHASRKIDQEDNYRNSMEASSWDTEAEPTPGKKNPL
jgi:hypothetical protein